MAGNSFLLLAILALVIVELSSFMTAPPASVVYVVDTKASSLFWKGEKATGEHWGNAPIASGELTVEDGRVTQGNFEIALSSITVADITDKDTNAKLVSHLKSADFFSTEKYPTSSFVLTSAKQKAGNEYLISGTLVIKGIANQLEFPATIVNEGRVIKASAKITVDRTKYDIKYRSSNFFENLGDKVIYDDFVLTLDLVAKAKTSI